MSHLKKLSVISNDLFPREIDIEVCLKTLKIYQKIEGDVNCVVWDASLVLAKYLETMSSQKSEFLSGIKVLELGSGLGVVGLTAATLGAQVTLTDLPEALSLLRLNINENKQKISSMGGYAIAESLVWGDNSSELVKEKRLWESFYEKISDHFLMEKIPEEQQHTNFRSPDIILIKINKKKY
ncbi:Methyltransferase-like protein 21D [Operophtera brumata]|uniref:Methyltransferase-like protein 21D n=1 Tax=Operophtera brumata TaxID=104452 RepID=A0A0L7KYM9_OPEBR|nr:Methyltransferase-like protein 21D [Operophtera brumata]